MFSFSPFLEVARNCRLVGASIALAACAASLARAQSLSVPTQVSVATGASLDQLGWSIALNGPGTRAVLGAVGDDWLASGAGAAYVFVQSGATWAQDARLVAEDGAANDFFGASVAMDLVGDRCVVGAILDDDQGFNSGAAYVFLRGGAGWAQEAKLTPLDGAASDSFGKTAAMDWAATRILVGVEDKDVGGANSGAAYVFVRSGSAWTQEAMLAPLDGEAGDGFGTAVALDSTGSRAVVSAANDDDGGSNAGSVYVWTRSGSTWTQEAKLTAPDAVASDFFGESVDIAALGDVLAIGAQGADDYGQNSGAAYVWRRSGSSWSHEARFTATDGAAGDFFGGRVAISGGGQRVLCGARDHDAGALNAGAVYGFARIGGSWQATHKTLAPLPGSGDQFGNDLAINNAGTVAAVGAPGTDAGPVDAGAGYVLTQDAASVPAEFATLQAALDASYPGDTVQVAPGSYPGNLDFRGRGVRVVAAAGPGTATLEGAGGAVVAMISGEPAGAELDGFVVTGGDAEFGAGMRIAGGAVGTVSRCTFTGNSNVTHGGGLEVDQASSPTLRDCTFRQNASLLGAGVAIGPDCQPLFERCRFENNAAGAGGGGGVFIGFMGAPTFRNCSFERNTTLGNGGALLFGGGTTARVEGCLLAQNSAANGAAAFIPSASTPVFLNCTVVENQAGALVGGLASLNGAPAVANSILWANTDASGVAAGAQVANLGGAGATVSTSDVEGGWSGAGSANVSSDPRFAAASKGDWRLGLGSPLIDAGNNFALPAGLSADLAGLPRKLDEPNTPDTGTGGSPIVDLGAYEAPDPCGPDGAPVAYCTPKPNSLGCTPTISFQGKASASDPNPFLVTATQELNSKNGLFFYGSTGRAEIPFLGGTLCLLAPLKRGPLLQSGGSAPPADDCSGSYAFDFNAWFQGGNDTATTVGQVLQGQFWSRDPQHPDGSGSGLSDAVEFQVCP